MGVWRKLGYIFSGLTIVAGFVLIGSGVNLSTQTNVETETDAFGLGNIFSQFGGLALVYGGVNTVVFGILIIWALVKSGQIESIDKNIKIIAEWAQSQIAKEGESGDDEKFLEDQQTKLNEEERYLADLERKKKDKEG